MANENLIVCDDEYLTAAYKVDSLGDYLSEASAYYCKILRYILDEAIKDEVITAGFSSLLEQVDPMVDAISDFKAILSDDIMEYITEIDEADSFLYDQI